MSIWLQKSASIQKRTSPLKFDHFRSKIPDFIDRIFQQSREQRAKGVVGLHVAFLERECFQRGMRAADFLGINRHAAVFFENRRKTVA